LASVTETVNYVYSADTGDLVSDVNKGSKANDDFTRSLDRASKGSHMMKGASSALGSTISGLAGIVAGATAGIIALGKATTMMTGVQEKINAVYGDSAESLASFEAEMSSLSTTLGVSQKDLELTSATLAITAQNMGATEGEAEKLGIAFAQVTAVAANFVDMPLPQAAQAMSAALRGEAEAADALNLSLNIASMDAFILQQQKAGVEINKTYSQMTAQEQMVIKLQASISQMAVMMGVSIPVMTDMATTQEALNMVTEKSSTTTSGYQTTLAMLKDTFYAVLEAITPFIESLFAIIQNTVNTIVTSKELMAILKGLAMVIGGVVAVALIFIDTIVTVVTQILSWIASCETLMAILQAVINIVGFLTASTLALINMIITAVGQFFAWLESCNLLVAGIQAVINILDRIFVAIDNLVSIISTVIGWVQNLVSAFDPLVNILETVLDLIGKVGDALGKLMDDFQSGGFVDIRSQSSSASGTASASMAGLGRSALPGMGGNSNATTNITYNVRTTKDMSLRNAERERRLYG